MSRKKLITLVSAGVVLVVVMFVGIAQWQGWINIGADTIDNQVIIGDLGDNLVQSVDECTQGIPIETSTGISEVGELEGNGTSTTYDTDGDGVADCKVMDLDGDGIFEILMNADLNYRVADLNSDGNIDGIYKNGDVVYDTNYDGRGDLTLKDTNDDGKLDTWEHPDLDGNIVFGIDTDGDHTVDIAVDQMGHVVNGSGVSDSDRDGIIDLLDHCPFEAATRDNDYDNDGCPDEASSPAEPNNAGTDLTNPDNPSPAEPLNDEL